MAKGKKKSVSKRADVEPGFNGRPTSTANVKRMNHILDRAKEEPGVTNVALAKELEISTMDTSHLADRLIAQGLLRLEKIGFNRHYHFVEQATEEEAA